MHCDGQINYYLLKIPKPCQKDTNVNIKWSLWSSQEKWENIIHSRYFIVVHKDIFQEGLWRNVFGFYYSYKHQWKKLKFSEHKWMQPPRNFGFFQEMFIVALVFICLHWYFTSALTCRFIILSSTIWTQHTWLCCQNSFLLSAALDPKAPWPTTRWWCFLQRSRLPSPHPLCMALSSGTSKSISTSILTEKAGTCGELLCDDVTTQTNDVGQRQREEQYQFKFSSFEVLVFVQVTLVLVCALKQPTTRVKQNWPNFEGKLCLEEIRWFLFIS